MGGAQCPLLCLVALILGLQETDAITEVIREFSEMFPSISVHLIDERNLYMVRHGMPLGLCLV